MDNPPRGRPTSRPRIPHQHPMKAPVFRGYVRRDKASYQQPYVWQMRQPWAQHEANGLAPTRGIAINEILSDARHYQNMHEQQ